MPSSGPETKVAMPAVVFTILRPVDDTVHIRVSLFPGVKILPMFSILNPFPYRVHFKNSTNTVAIHIIINFIQQQSRSHICYNSEPMHGHLSKVCKTCDCLLMSCDRSIL